VLTKLALVFGVALTIAAASPASVAAAPASADTSIVLAQQGGEGGAETETGPPWTYQMARITVVLVVFLALGLGLLYYRLVVRRRRGDA
jgi:hypothetical protein